MKSMKCLIISAQKLQKNTHDNTVVIRIVRVGTGAIYPGLLQKLEGEVKSRTLYH